MAGLQFVGLMGKGGSGGDTVLNVSSGTILPGTVPERQMFVVTSTPAVNWYVSTNKPTAPVVGDIWIRPGEGEIELIFSTTSPYFKLGLWQASQYDGSKWQFKAGYLGVGGAWRQFARPLPAPGTPLEQWTWGEIALASQTGLAQSYFLIGDAKNMVSGSVTYQVEIIGFNHDDLADGSGKAGITFCMKSCFTTPQRVNVTDTNVGGWGSSEFRTAILPNTILPTVPADLRTVAKPVIKRTSAGNQSTNIVTTTDSFFLLSEVEIFGTTTYSRVGEGSQYAFLATATSRIKTLGPTGAATAWRQRSPFASGTTAFCFVHTGGTPSYHSASDVLGISLAFCV